MLRRFYKQRNQSDHLTAVIYNLCLKRKVPVTYTRIREIVSGHPDFPSLLSIVETLQVIGLKTEALRGSISDLSEHILPTIAHFKNGSFVILEEIRDGFVNYLDPSRGRVKRPLKDFEESWSGIILHVKEGAHAGEKEYSSAKKKELLFTIRKRLILPAIVVFGTIGYFQSLTGLEKIGTLGILWSLKILGIIICTILALSGIAESPFLTYFCSLGKKANCLKVLNSPAGKLLGIPMSEIGLIYFGGGLFGLFFIPVFSNTNSYIFVIGVLNVLTLPYTFFSVIYQAFVIRKWCWLCLSIQVLFWIEFIVFYPVLSEGIERLDWFMISPLLLGLALSSFVWIGIRRILVYSKRGRQLELKIMRMKADPIIIDAKLSAAQKVNNGSLPGDLVIGDPNASTSIVIVLNPFCSACHSAYQELNQLILNENIKLKGIIRFLVHMEHSPKKESINTSDYLISRDMISLIIRGDIDHAKQAVDDWFNGSPIRGEKKIQKWREKYGQDVGVQEKASEILFLQSKWAVKTTPASTTPAIFFNKSKLPQEFQINDLKYYLMRLNNNE